MDIEMINPWTQVKSYHGHFERSQTHISADTFWKRSRKVMKKIIQIRQFRESYIVINCLNMNDVIL